MARLMAVMTRYMYVRRCSEEPKTPGRWANSLYLPSTHEFVPSRVPDRPVDGRMASRFDRWLEHNAGGAELESRWRVMPGCAVISPEELAANPHLETVSALSADDDDLKEWVGFLRHCGRFSIR